MTAALMNYELMDNETAYKAMSFPHNPYGNGNGKACSIILDILDYENSKNPFQERREQIIKW